MCRRAEKNSELNQISKMELLEKIVKGFKDINYCSENTQKTNLRQFLLLSYRQWESDFNETGLRQKKQFGRRTLLQKSAFKVTEKEKPSWMFSSTCMLLKLDASSDHFVETSIKYQYIEMRLHWKETVKRLSFLTYQKLINKGHLNNHDFCLLKAHQKRHVEVASIIHPWKLYRKCILR